MTELDIQFICRCARNTIGPGIDYIGANSELLDIDYYTQEVSPEDFDVLDVLKGYCYNLISRIIYEQANCIACNREYIFDPRETIEAILKNKHNIEVEYDFDAPGTDYLDKFNEYTEFLDEHHDFIYEKIIADSAEKVYEILSKEEDFVKAVEGYFEF